jgi:hypothetical protein
MHPTGFKPSLLMAPERTEEEQDFELRVNDSLTRMFQARL